MKHTLSLLCPQHAALLILAIFVATILPANAAEPQGLVIIYDGTHSREYSTAYEYARMQSFGSAFKLVLANGGIVSGMSAQILVALPYGNTSADNLKQMEDVAGMNANAAVLLKSRITKMKNALASSLTNSPAGAPAGIPNLEIGGKTFYNVQPKGLSGDALHFAHQSGVSGFPLADLQLKTLKLLASANPKLRENADFNRAMDSFVPAAMIDGKLYSGVKVQSKKEDDALVLLTDAGPRSCKSNDLRTADRINLLGKAPLAAPTTAPLADSSGPPAKPRFNQRQSALLVAASDPFQLNGQSIDPGDARKDVLNKYTSVKNQIVRTIAKAVLEFMDVNDQADAAAEASRDALKNFAKDWRNEIRDTFMDATWEWMTNGGKVSGGNLSGSVADTERIVTPLQEAAIRRRGIECAGSALRRVVRENAAHLAESVDAGRPAVTGVLDVSLRRDRGFIWMEVRNRTSRTLHHCLITDRRMQDADKVNTQEKDRAIAKGLMNLLDFSAKATAVNDLNGALMMETQRIEHGAFIYMPEMKPGDTATFIAAPADNLGFTLGIDVSVWCDEGKELNHSADLSQLQPAPRRGK